MQTDVFASEMQTVDDAGCRLAILSFNHSLERFRPAGPKEAVSGWVFDWYTSSPFVLLPLRNRKGEYNLRDTLKLPPRGVPPLWIPLFQ